MVSTQNQVLKVSPAQSNLWWEQYIASLPGAAQNVLQHAYALMKKHYPEDACTDFGESLFSNLFITAKTVADMDLMADTVAAALICYLPNFLPDWKSIVKDSCGDSVVQLVSGLDQIQKLTYFVSVNPSICNQ